MSQEPNYRIKLSQSRRVVIKLGTRLLVHDDGTLNRPHLSVLVERIAKLHQAGKEVILVTSGAVGAGLEALPGKQRPTTLAGLQMAAAVGQSRLMAIYERLFADANIVVGQVLLTHADLNNRNRHLNARNTFRELLDHRVLPIVNENDVVSVDELRVGDNDRLAAMVTLLVDADALVLLTTAPGFKAGGAEAEEPPVSLLTTIGAEEEQAAQGKGGSLSTGGMAGKLEAAQLANRAGALAVIADGRREDTLPRLFSGEEVGTLIQCASSEATTNPLTHRKRWLAYFHRTEGKCHIDEGAAEVLLRQGSSLLPIGVVRVEGSFDAGAVIQIVAPDGHIIAHGLSEYSNTDLQTICGLRSEDVRAQLATRSRDEAVHRDNLVLLD